MGKYEYDIEIDSIKIATFLDWQSLCRFLQTCEGIGSIEIKAYVTNDFGERISITSLNPLINTVNVVSNCSTTK